MWGGGVRGGWVCVRPPTPHALASTPDHHTQSAPSPEARGAPARRVDAPLRCAGPQGPHRLVRGWAAWFDGGFFRGCRAGARSHTFRVAGGRFGDPAPSTVWLRKALRLARTHCAHPLARRPRVLVARQHAVSEPTSLTCVHGCGRGRGCRITRLGRMERVLSSCTLCDAVERRVGRVRGQKQRAWLCRAGRRRGRVGGGFIGARRGVAGDVPGTWPGRRHARITQRRHVGELEPELYFLGVGS